MPQATAVSFCCTTRRPSPATRAASNCSRSSPWRRGLRPSRRTGLWLLCPMEDPQAPPQLDRITVSVIPGDAEQFYVPGEFAESGGKDLKAS